MYFILSWRNLWRNKKRTVIVGASIFFAVILAVFMRSGQLGSYSYMIHSSAKLFTGYLQIQGKDYWENRSLDYSIVIDDHQRGKIDSLRYITSATPRLESFALISYKKLTKVSQVIGIDPGLEDRMNGLSDRVISGQYLDNGEEGILVAEGLAKMLKVNTGDSIIIYGQGYHGQIAAARLPVKGIVKLPFPEMNNALVYLSLQNAQEVYSALGRVTSLSLMINDIRNLDEVLIEIRKIFGSDYNVMTWDEMMPELEQSIQMDNVSGIIMLAILYIVIAFGVFGTVMMMTTERTREFGILISVGMKKSKLIAVTTIESIMISFLGVIVGFLGSIPVIYYFYYNPIRLTGEMARAYETLGIEAIMAFSVDPGIFLGQSVVVLIIALTTAMYPFLFINRLTVVEAITK
ncbi:MAG: ABC transporter permease [Calditrichaceae bacterium]